MKLIRSLAGAALATAFLAIAPPTEAQETMLNIETNLPASHATSRAMEIFKDEVARLSKSSIKVEVAAGSPRGLKELVDAVYVGSLFATPTSIANFSRVVPEAAALSLPFIFDNYDEALRAVDGPVGRLMATKIEAKGFTVLAWMALGEFNFTNSKRPIKTLDDFKGLRIRVLPNATHLATFQASAHVRWRWISRTSVRRCGRATSTAKNRIMTYRTPPSITNVRTTVPASASSCSVQ